MMRRKLSWNTPLSMALYATLLTAPLSQVNALIDEDFSNGTLGEPVATESGNPAADGSGNWILAEWDGELTRAPVYGGDETNLTFANEGDGLSVAYFDRDHDAVENFNVVFHNVSISSENRAGTDAAIFAARKDADDRGEFLDFVYEFRPVDDTSWRIDYVDFEGRTTVGFIDDRPTLEFTELEIRVHGDGMILYADGEALDFSLRETSGFDADGFADDAFWVALNSLENDIVSLEFDRVTSDEIGEFVPPEAPPPPDLPLVETFNNGVPGESIHSQQTSDGQGRWLRGAALGENAHVNYGGETDAVTYEPFTDAAQASVFLEANVDEIENYNVVLDEVILRGGLPELTSNIFISTRRNSTDLLSGYEFRQWKADIRDDEGNLEEVQFRWAIWYRLADGSESVDPGNRIAGTVTAEEWDNNDLEAFRRASEFAFEGLELRVRGNTKRLFLNGEPFDSEWRPTQGEYNDGTRDHAFQISTNVTGDDRTLLNPTFHGLTIEEPPPPPEIPEATNEWQIVDDFSGRELGEIAGQGEWRQTIGGNGDVMDNPFGDGRVLFASGGLYTIPINIPDGEVGTVFFRARATGMTDFSFATSKVEVMHGLVNESASQVAFRGANVLDVIDKPSGPDHIHTLTSHDSHTWYDIWMVVDNANKTQSYYIQGGEFTEPTLLSDDQERTEFDFRHADDHAGEDVFSFGMRAFNMGPVFLDQVWFKGLGTEAEVSLPAGAGPIPDEQKDKTGPLLAYEGFSYSEGDVAGLTDGSGWIEPWREDGSHISPEVLSPGFSHGDLAVAGNRLQVQNIGGGGTGAVGFRFLELGAVDPDLLDEFGHIGRPGTSVYLSFIGQGVEPITDSFWGISTFRASSERLFVGKSGNINNGWRLVQAGTGNRIDSDVPFGELSFFVVRIDHLEEPEEAGDDLIYARGYLFHNPDPADGDPALTEAVAEIESTAPQSFNRIRVTGREEGFEIDEVRVGLTWDAVTPTGGAPQGFADWQDLHFGEQSGDPMAEPDADPDADGLPNIAEYALGGDPLTPDRSPLPEEGRRTVGEDEFLTLTVERPADITDVDYSVDTAGELGTWNPGAAELVESNEEAGIITEVYRDTQPIGQEPKRFLRLRLNFQ